VTLTCGVVVVELRGFDEVVPRFVDLEVAVLT
jgi:hypothetical protein